MTTYNKLRGIKDRDIKLFFQAIIKFILGVLVIGVLLFIPENTIYYWNGGLFI